MNIISDSLGVSACESSPDRWLSLEYLPIEKPLLGGISPPEAQKITEHFNARLFDEARADIPARRSYAILDAAAHPALPEFLETSDLTHACFFTGAAFKETGEAAPWLVELKPDHRLTRMLISASDRPGGLWDQDPGIIIKSNLEFDALWSHCRKFTRIQDSGGQWLYYRYWSAPVSTRVMSLGNRPEMQQFVSPFFPAHDPGFEVLLLNRDLQARLTRLPGTFPPRQRPILTDEVRRTIRQVRRAQQYEELIEITLHHVKGKTALTEEAIRQNLRIKRDWYFDVGFWQRDHIVKLLVWEVLLGPDFIERYEYGTIRAIIASAQQPYEAIMNIEYFLEAQEIRRNQRALEMRPQQ